MLNRDHSQRGKRLEKWKATLKHANSFAMFQESLNVMQESLPRHALHVFAQVQKAAMGFHDMQEAATLYTVSLPTFCCCLLFAESCSLMFLPFKDVVT